MFIIPESGNEMKYAKKNNSKQNWPHLDTMYI